MRPESLALPFLVLMLPLAASAHSRSESWSQWHTADTGLSGTLTLPSREATRLPGQGGNVTLSKQEFAGYLGRRVQASSVAGPCAPATVEPLRAEEGYLRFALGFRCDGPPVSVEIAVLFDSVQGHTHFARLDDGAAEAVLTETSRLFVFTPRAHRELFRDYLALGVRHILSGPDHLAFLLALLLAATRWRNILVTVTGFTVGHSLTLSLAVTGLIRAGTSLVEAFIGFTVALVAAEILALRDGYWRVLAVAATTICFATGLVAWSATNASPWHLAAYCGLAAFTFCYLILAGNMNDRTRRGAFLAAAASLFGLVHGLGFAGFLLQTGLPSDGLIAPLLGFNVGVELGQLLVVVALMALGWSARRFASTSMLRAGETLAAAALCGLGLAWFTARSFV